MLNYPYRMHKKLGLTTSQMLPSHQLFPILFTVQLNVFSYHSLSREIRQWFSLGSHVLICAKEHFSPTVALTVLDR